MRTMVLEAKVIEKKNNYTIEDTIINEWDVNKPIIKKVLYGVEIQKPTAYRVYIDGDRKFRTWVFGELEINPDRYNVQKIAK